MYWIRGENENATSVDASTTDLGALDRVVQAPSTQPARGLFDRTDDPLDTSSVRLCAASKPILPRRR